jgi:hypothetical protein
MSLYKHQGARLRGWDLEYRVDCDYEAELTYQRIRDGHGNSAKVDYTDGFSWKPSPAAAGAPVEWSLIDGQGGGRHANFENCVSST